MTKGTMEKPFFKGFPLLHVEGVELNVLKVVFLGNHIDIRYSTFKATHTFSITLLTYHFLEAHGQAFGRVSKSLMPFLQASSNFQWDLNKRINSYVWYIENVSYL